MRKLLLGSGASISGMTGVSAAENLAGPSKELSGMKIILCITGSVAAMESPRIARELVRHGADVIPVLSKSARRLIKADLLAWATGNEVISRITSRLEHVQLAGGGREGADLILIAPCTANTLSKISSGISDTTVTTFASVALGSGTRVVVAPGMHEPMYSNPLLKSSLTRLQSVGVEIIDPLLVEGKAKLASVDKILSHIIRLNQPKDMRGMNVLVTGGPTISRIDSVRTISNRSSGKMGVALAKVVRDRGASVTLIYGPGSAAPPDGIVVKRVETTEEMFSCVKEELANGRINLLIAAAAPSDFVVPEPLKQKISTRERPSLSLELVASPKIINLLKKRKTIHLVAFKASDHKSGKLESELEAIFAESAADMVVVNEISRPDSGFGSDYNEVAIYQNPKKRISIPRAPKDEIAKAVVDHFMYRHSKRKKNV